MKLYKKMKFNKFLELYLEYQKEFIKESTYALYTTFCTNKIRPFFNGLLLEDLSTAHLQQFSKFLTTEGNSKTGSGLSYNSTRDIVNFLKSSFKYLFNQNVIKSFDIEIRIHKPNEKKKVEIFSDLEIIQLRDYLKQNKSERNLAILIAIYSGIRIGELCALQWENIDLNNNYIYINKTLQRIQIKTPKATTSKIIITPPKSSSSIRHIPVNNELVDYLQLMRQATGYLTTGTENFIEPRALRYHYTAILKKLFINNRPFHCLRHTFATRLIKNTNDFKTVSELLGHSSISITLDTYTHTSEYVKISCINKF